MNSKISPYQAVVIGVSAGGMEALPVLFLSLRADFPLPILVVQHIHRSSDNFLFLWLNEKATIPVKQADEKEKIVPGRIYIAPPDYHLLVEKNRTLSFSIDERVNFSRPSVDVLFETAAEVYGPGLIGIILTGANNDGSKGLKKIKEAGGYAIVQDPQTAEVPTMPQEAIRDADPDMVLSLDAIGPFLQSLVEKQQHERMEGADKR